MSDTSLPPQWAETTLDEIADIQGGIQKGKKRSSSLPLRDVPYLRVANVQRGYLDLDVVQTIQANEDEISQLRLQVGDVLFNEGGDRDKLGRGWIWSGAISECIHQNHVFRARIIDRILDPKLLSWYGNTVGQQYFFDEGKQTTNLASLNSSKLKALPVLVPPQREQTRIVEAIESYLTRLDDAIATLERVQRNLKRYRASVLKAAVEGRLVPTEAELARAEGRVYEPASVLLERILAERRRRWEEAELAKMKAKGKAPKNDKWKAKYVEPATLDASELPELPEGWCWATLETLLREPLRNGHSAKQVPAGDVRTLTLSAVTERDFSPRNTKLTGAKLDIVRHLWLKPGDIFVERSNTPELVGTAALYSGPSDFAIFPDLLIRVRVSEEIPPPFIEAVLRSNRVRAYLRVSAQGIAGSMPKISQDTLLKLAVPIPPQREQLRIVAEVDRILSLTDGTEFTTSASCLRAKRLRQSILKWAFEGRLVDQDPTDEPATVLLERIRAERPAAKGKKQPRARRVNTRTASA